LIASTILSKITLAITGVGDEDRGGFGVTCRPWGIAWGGEGREVSGRSKERGPSDWPEKGFGGNCGGMHDASKGTHA